MNKEDIIRMYAKANGWSPAAFTNTLEELERFAALVASAQLEEVAKEFDKMPFGDTAASFAIFVRNMKK